MCYLNKYWNYQQVIWKQNLGDFPAINAEKIYADVIGLEFFHILWKDIVEKDWNLEKTIIDDSFLTLWIVHSALIFIMILTVPVLQTTPTSVCHLQIKPSVKCPKLIVFKNSSNVTTYNLDHVYLFICQTLGLLGWLYLIPNRDYSLHIAWSPYNLFTACLVPCGQLVRKLWSQHILGDAPTEYDLST